jgi:hypothetical protein
MKELSCHAPRVFGVGEAQIGKSFYRYSSASGPTLTFSSFTNFPRALEVKRKETVLYNVPSSEAYAEGSLVLGKVGRQGRRSQFFFAPPSVG